MHSEEKSILILKFVKGAKMMNVQGFSRSGIRIVNDAKVSPLMKDAFLAYARWLRKNYDFPQRVVVYVKDSNSIKTANAY